jgi:NAD(P)-dependent dehydrogenase (short-subunit alcohol dehydrogenase family)
MKETWRVTGSSVGLGRSIAEAALAEGHDVVASPLRQRKSALSQLNARG